jgi:hypothetical protein
MMPPPGSKKIFSAEDDNEFHELSKRASIPRSADAYRRYKPSANSLLVA